jgi:hypothetical protein
MAAALHRNCNTKETQVGYSADNSSAQLWLGQHHFPPAASLDRARAQTCYINNPLLRLVCCPPEHSTPWALLLVVCCVPTRTDTCCCPDLRLCYVPMHTCCLRAPSAMSSCWSSCSSGSPHVIGMVMDSGGGSTARAQVDQKLPPSPVNGKAHAETSPLPQDHSRQGRGFAMLKG